MSSRILENLKDGQIEILDRALRPFCILRGAAAQAQGLRHKAVAVLARDPAGRLVLAKRPAGYDVSAFGPVLAGEGRADCASRLMLEVFGHAPPMRALGELCLANRHLSLFSCRLPGDALALAPLEASAWLWASHAEVAALLGRQPELFAPLFRRIMGVVPKMTSDNRGLSQ